MAENSTLQAMSEVQLRANASSLVLRLTGDEWLPSRVGQIFSGLTARQADPLGWNASLHLHHISPTSPPHLPHISSASPLHLLCISYPSPLHLPHISYPSPSHLPCIFRQADPLGWNAVVAPTLHAGLASLSDSNRLLTISLPASPR